MPEAPEPSAGGVPADETAAPADPIDVQVDDRYLDRVDGTLIHAAVAATLERERAEDWAAGRLALTVAVVDDEEIRRLNRDFRGLDEPTDVLSFATLDEEAEWVDPADDGDPRRDYLGDVVVSHPRAEAQAAEYGHSLDRELAFLAVHGTLHLLGHNHEQAEERARMRAAEEAVMAGFPALAR